LCCTGLIPFGFAGLLPAVRVLLDFAGLRPAGPVPLLNFLYACFILVKAVFMALRE
jgi:hypothetical protein